MSTLATPSPAIAAPAEVSGLPILVLGALGVVYGDIGTSPLYAFREALHVSTAAGAVFDQNSVLGLLSLIAWALIALVTLKYVTIVLRAAETGSSQVSPPSYERDTTMLDTSPFEAMLPSRKSCTPSEIEVI